MYKALEKIIVQDKFTFQLTDDLENVCNCSENHNGIFIVYDMSNDNKELIMVGSTGTIQNDGSLKSKNGGLYDKIVNGHQFAKSGRKYTWPTQMKKENITALEVFWYDTFNSNNRVIPTFLEAQILQEFFEVHGKLPRWNVAF